MTDDSLADVQPYTPPADVIAAFDYVDGLHLFMIAVTTGDVDGMQRAVDLIEGAARRMHAASQ